MPGEIGCWAPLEASSWSLPLPSTWGLIGRGWAGGQWVRAPEHHGGRLPRASSHLAAGCSVLQSLLGQLSHIYSSWHLCKEKQGVVSLKSNHEHWNSLHLWLHTSPCFLMSQREYAVDPWACASQDVQHATIKFTTSQPASTTLNSSKQSAGKHIRDFCLSFSHVLAKKQWTMGTALAYQEEWEKRYCSYMKV